jgi:hypothetical protein
MRRLVELVQPRRAPTRFGSGARPRRPKSQQNQGPLATSQAQMCPRTANSGQGFADEAAWSGHLAALGLGAGWRRLVSEAAIVGAITARGLLNDTVIVSDDAGQFDVLTHALCWVHAERHLRRVVCATAEQRRLVDLQRQLVWFSNRAPSVNPSSRRRRQPPVGPGDGGPTGRRHPDRLEPSSVPRSASSDTDPVSGPAPSFRASKAPVPGPWFSPRSARGRRMMGLRASRPSNVAHAVRERPQPNQRNGRTHVPAGTPRRVRRTDASR